MKTIQFLSKILVKLFGVKKIDSDENHESKMQMLTYLLNEVAEKAGFKRENVGGQKRHIYWKHSMKGVQTIRQRGSDWAKPDVQLFRVFEAKLSLGHVPNGDNGAGGKELFLNVDVAHKHLSAVSLRDLLYDMQEKYPNEEEFRAKVENEFVRKRALVSYTSSWVQVDHIDWEKNETFEFEKKDGTKTSIGGYLQSRYGQDVESGELCTIVCRDGRGRQTNDYLPQHVFVTVSKEQTADVDARIKDMESMVPRERLRIIEEFVREFEDAQGHEFALQVNSKPYEIQGLVIPDIKMSLKTRHKQSLNPKDFTAQWRGVQGFMNENDSMEIRVGGICTDSRTAGDIENQFRRYTQKRNIRDLTKFVGCEVVRKFSEDELEDVFSNMRADIAVIVIDDGKRGSEQKAITSRIAGKYKIKTQFIRSTNIGGRPTPFQGAMDDVMAKCGAAWYKVDYGFEKLDAKDIWILGVDVYKSQSEAMLSGISFQLCTDITAGTLGNDSIGRRSYVLAPKKNISPMEPFKKTVEDLLREAYKRTDTVPKTILVFRGGISMAELIIFRTNEVMGLIRGITEVFGTKKKEQT